MDSQLFVALARVLRRNIGHFNVQDLVNTAWAFATVGELTPALLAPISILMLDTMEMKDAKPQLTCYHCSYQMLLAKAAAQWGMSDFNTQDLSNTTWAFATADQTDALLFAVLSRATERCMCDFDAQALTNTAWAFATVGQMDAKLFTTSARASERRVGGFNAQELANMA